MLYNPATGTFTATANSMTATRAFFTATFLDPAVVSAHGGEIFIAGGDEGGLPTGRIGTAELFDPTTNTFTAISAPMNEARAFHSAVLLKNGKVLLFGGRVISIPAWRMPKSSIPLPRPSPRPILLHVPARPFLPVLRPDA